MPYRRTEKVTRKLALRRAAILNAARTLAAEGGMNAVQIVPVAHRAGIATGTVYRYFPAKTDLVAALVEALTASEIAVLVRAGDAAPGPMSALAAAIVTFAARVCANRRLAFALIAEPGESALEGARTAARRAFTAAFEARITAAMRAGHLPDQDAAVAAAALLGALVEGLIGPLAPKAADPARTLVEVQMLALFALRALGVVDARARGLVVQAAAALKQAKSDSPDRG
jgi:AcrR family transcriptional regulator